MNRVLLRVAAARDIEEAFLWYESQRRGLGEEFLSAVQAAVDGIAGNPRAFAVIHRDTRRALLRRFPYGVFYRVLDSVVVVVACFHAKRHPRRWRSRR